MSKLVDLLTDANKYPRLNALNAGRNELKSSYSFSGKTTFSVRDQFSTASDARQNNAVNFFDNSGSAFETTYAGGFKVDKATTALSTVGYRKAIGTDASDYIGEPNNAGKAEATSGLTHYTKLILNSNIRGSQLYDPVRTDNTYLAKINGPGETLTYGTIPAITLAPTRIPPTP